MIQPEINHSTSFKKKPATATSPAIRVVMPMPTTDNKPKLLTQLSQAIRSRHYSRKTEATYIHWIKRFIFFHNVRHPKDMAEPEINAYLRTCQRLNTKSGIMRYYLSLQACFKPQDWRYRRGHPRETIKACSCGHDER
jgi:hypothetical protein